MVGEILVPVTGRGGVGEMRQCLPVVETDLEKTRRGRRSWGSPRSRLGTEIALPTPSLDGQVDLNEGVPRICPSQTCFGSRRIVTRSGSPWTLFTRHLFLPTDEGSPPTRPRRPLSDKVSSSGRVVLQSWWTTLDPIPRSTRTNPSKKVTGLN